MSSVGLVYHVWGKENKRMLMPMTWWSAVVNVPTARLTAALCLRWDAPFLCFQISISMLARRLISWARTARLAALSARPQTSSTFAQTSLRTTGSTVSAPHQSASIHSYQHSVNRIQPAFSLVVRFNLLSLKSSEWGCLMREFCSDGLHVAFLFLKEISYAH